MPLRNLGFVVLLAWMVLHPSPSLAQTGTPATGTAADGDARSLFTMGQAAFDQGRYQAALDYFQQAYDLSHRPQLLYNIGQAADRMRDDRRALTAFEGYLREVPTAPQRTSVEARVQVLRATIEAADAREAERLDALAAAQAAQAAQAAGTTEGTAASPVEDDAPPSRGGRTAGFIVAGGGAAALAVGATFLALGLSDKSAVENVSDGSTFASIEDEYDRASTRITVGTILLGVGAAAGATGLVLALRSGGSDDDEPTALRLHVLPTGMMLRGSF